MTKYIERYRVKPLLKNKEYLPVLAVFIFIFGMIGYTLFADSNAIDLKKEMSLRGIIENTFNQKSIYYLKLNTKEKWIKLKDFRNKSYPLLDYSFMNIVEKGDSIIKLKNSDTITLIRAKNTYYFKIEEY